MTRSGSTFAKSASTSSVCVRSNSVDDGAATDAAPRRASSSRTTRPTNPEPPVTRICRSPNGDTPRNLTQSASGHVLGTRLACADPRHHRAQALPDLFDRVLVRLASQRVEHRPAHLVLEDPFLRELPAADLV